MKMFTEHPLMLRITKSCLAAAVIVGLSACADSSEQLPVQLVYQDQYCYQDEGLSQLASGRDLVKLRSKSLAPGAPPVPAEATPAYEDGTRLLLISLGAKNSGGFGLTLNALTAGINERTLILPVSVEEPEPGTMQSMQITSPCLVVAVPPGDYEKVQVESKPQWQIGIGAAQPRSKQ